jgi:hypothetical protein
MTLAGTEFLRRFFLHVLPKGFVRIRHFGFLANRSRAKQLALCRQLLAMSPAVPAPAGSREDLPSWQCPRCGTPMVVAQRLTATEISRCNYFDSS